jgi:hypothetical protein
MLDKERAGGRLDLVISHYYQEEISEQERAAQEHATGRRLGSVRRMFDFDQLSRAPLKGIIVRWFLPKNTDPLSACFAQRGR